MTAPTPDLSAAIRPRALIKLLRPLQWIKNGFVLAPLMFTGAFLDAASIREAVFATLLFCLASSATYIVNDINDIEADRRHASKSRTRPLASGAVSVSMALALLALLAALLLAGCIVMPRIGLGIAFYIALSLSYTFYLKRVPVVDIFAIAFGFVLRVWVGAHALEVPLSAWMAITTLCLALYLGAIKRRQELRHHGSDGREVLAQYSVALVDRYAEMSGMGAIIFYSLFVMSAKPQLVGTIPLVLFGLFRYWFVVERLEGGESPADVLAHDWQLGVTLLAWCGTCAWALWPAGV